MNRTLKLVCALVLGVTLAACGGTDKKSGTPAAPATITLGFSAWPGWFPWQVAEDEGLFKKNGVDVKLKYFESYTDSLTALATGAIDANSQTLNDTLSSASGGAKPGRSCISWPTWAEAITSCQICAGKPPPVTAFISAPESLPTQTPVT